MTIKITGLQLAQEALKRELSKITSEYALVGIHESAGKVKGDSMNMATLGATQHFGSGNIPSRPFLDLGVAKSNREYLEAIQNGVKRGLTSKEIIDQVGLLAVASVKEFITDLRSPPNTPQTIKRKGSSNPLIDTGAMRSSITYTVSSKKPEVSL